MKKARNLIFIGGIHGSGKGTICKKVASKNSLRHITASEILKWEEISSKKNKLVENIDSTQDRLIRGLNLLIMDDENYILDGHYCLLNSEQQPEKIPEETFFKINPKLMIVVTEDEELIQERLFSRDGVKYEISLLKKMQELEIDYAKYLSRKLNIPFFDITNENWFKLDSFIQK